MILCEKCNNYFFPECDEDGIWSTGCKSPKVVSVFENFHRLRKCKYYRQITYEKFFRETRLMLSRVISYSFHYRDKRYPNKLNMFSIEKIRIWRNWYLEFRDYLFELKDRETELSRKNKT